MPSSGKDSDRRETLSILDGSTFVVSDRHGDIEAGPDQVEGLFFRDTRHLSLWRLTVDGRKPTILSTDDVAYFMARYFLTLPTGTIYRNPAVSIIRTRLVGDGFHEDVAILNHGAEAIEVDVRLEADADFADLFEVKDLLSKKGERYTERPSPGSLKLGYRRGDFVRETLVEAGEGATVGDHEIVFRVSIPAHGEWQKCIEVSPVSTEVAGPKYRHGEARARPSMDMGLDDWIASAPSLETDWDDLRHIYVRSLTDLAALRFQSVALPGLAPPAAGLPWFMSLFGRDSLITSFQALPFVPGLARDTLRVLAARQGTTSDDFREEDPGKIMHEVRFGELTVFAERPHSPYYGSADATPLFLILLDEYERWTGDRELVTELEGAARAALEWIDRYGDRDGHGYIEYERRTEAGLENQCWKDSWNSVLFADGSMSATPRALCEIQGYAYDAKVRAARLARVVWQDPGLADRLEQQAGELKRRFNADFWLPDRQLFALAIDGDRRPVDSLTSNIGHLLWSGIVDDDKAAAIVEHLMSDRLYSGWGVRTMAEGEAGYNPIEYHNGTVWPHDNSIIAAGLARYGYRQEAARIASSILAAGAYFRYRLPEVFAGYPRTLTDFPVEYPTACSPQAWAAGAPLLFIRVLLGLEPSGDRLQSEPFLPASIEKLTLRGIRGPWGQADVIGNRALA